MTISSSQRRPLVSVLFSFRNEAEVIPELLGRLRQVLGASVSSPAGTPALPGAVDFEFIFVNDASTDQSLQLLTEEAKSDQRIKVLNMSRRFGVAECHLAAMKYARGDAVITMDTDLQDPPEVIPELIAKWQAGNEVVYTVRTAREGESAFKIWLTGWAYKAIRLVANEELPVEAGDFKLIGRRVVYELLKLNEKDPYLRGLVTWMGFKQTPVYYKRAARPKGETHFPLFRSKGPIITFVFGFTSFSILPLVGFLLLGLLFTAASVSAAIVLCAMKLHSGHAPGRYWVFIALAFFSGLQLMGIGTVGLYLGRVYNDVRNRPRYIVESALGFSDKPETISQETVGDDVRSL
jgi:dolichol-phosphate mannosyltransferase